MGEAVDTWYAAQYSIGDDSVQRKLIGVSGESWLGVDRSAWLEERGRPADGKGHEVPEAARMTERSQGPNLSALRIDERARGGQGRFKWLRWLAAGLGVLLLVSAAVLAFWGRRPRWG